MKTKNEYLPRKQIWVLYDNRKFPYYHWVENKEDAETEIKWMEKQKGYHYYKQVVVCKPWKEFKDTKTEGVWFLFDLSNGHAPSPRYLWEFKTREEARIYRRKHNKMKHAASLSKPFRYVKHYFNFYP